MTNKKLIEKLQEDMDMRGFSNYTKDSGVINISRSININAIRRRWDNKSSTKSK